MSRRNARLKAFRYGTWQSSVPVKVDANAVRAHWSSLPLDEKLRVLRFEDTELMQRVSNIWHELCISDFACHLIGVRGLKLSPQDGDMSLFAMEGYVDGEDSIHDAVLFAKLAFVEDDNVIETLECRLGSPLLVGRAALQRRDWPLLFKVSPNSWSQLTDQLFKLVELAIYYAYCERDAHKPLPTLLEAAPRLLEGRSSKRRARKKRANLNLRHLDDMGSPVCGVCDGTRLLLDDPCPLCVDESDDEDSFALSKADEASLAAKTWLSGWHLVGVGETRVQQSERRWVVYEYPGAQSQKVSGSCHAVVKNTFLEILPVCFVSDTLGLSRTRSLPCL